MSEADDLRDENAALRRRVAASEHAVRRSEARFAVMFRERPVALAITSVADRQYVDVNDRFLQMFDIARVDVIGRIAKDVIAWSGVGTRELFYEKLLSDGAVSEMETTLRIHDGRRVTVLLSSSPIELDGRDCYLSTLMDITDRKRAEEALGSLTQRLLHSNQELEELAMVAAHDLQEPLRKIRMFGDRLKEKCEGELGPEGNDFLTRMQNAAERGQSLIGGLLAYSRVTSKGQRAVDVDLGNVARQVVADLEAQIASVGGHVEIGSLPLIEADPLQMRQLIQNLVTNALKFHRSGTPPIVRVESSVCAPSARVGEWWQITVRDNGIGFEAKYVERIFRLFQRLNARSEYDGSGIGLAVCKKIVERHGGSIVAENGAEGGATFVVTLPRKAEQEGETQANAEAD